MPKKKSYLKPALIQKGANETYNTLGRSYYIFCLEQAMSCVEQARMLVVGDIVDENHELQKIETLLDEAIAAS